MRISLRGRLALWYALATPLVVFALAFTAQQVVVMNLYEGLDGILEKRTSIVASAILASPAHDRDTMNALIEQLTEEKFPSVPLLVRIADNDGTVLAEFGEIPDPVIPTLNTELRDVPSDGKFISVRIHGTEALRVFIVPVRAPGTDTPVVILQTGESLLQINTARQRLWLYTFLEGFVGSLIVMGIGLLIIHRGFRPLDRILQRVREIGSSSLQIGLPEEPRPPELQHLANSLNTMWQRLDDAFTANRDFLANVSHDLRTPLTVLQGQVEVLLMDPTLNSEARESLDRMAREVRRLIRMTNNLLLGALIESKPIIEPQPVDLRELLEEIISEVWVLAKDIDLGLDAAEDAIIPGDRDLLKQVVLNVVDNAIKFTPKGGEVEMALKPQGTYVTIQVKDTGPGIPPETLATLLDLSPRMRAPQSASGSGTGLGLAIVKQIAELHGGQVDIASQVGSGTTVRIRLPRTVSLQPE